jgi:hypothetical protein
MISQSELITYVDKAIEKTAWNVKNKLEDIIRREYTGFSLSLGQATIDSVIVKEVSLQVSIVLKASGQKALIAEYGKGSLMDKDNPGLANYLSGYEFNTLRLKYGLATLARLKGDYYLDLDGNVHEGKSNNPYWNVEIPSKRHGVNPMYQPLEPKHIVRETVRQNINWILTEFMSNVVSVVPFHRLFENEKIVVKI